MRPVAGGLGETSAGFLLGEVDHLTLPGDPDQALETERATEHVLGETLATGAAVGVQPSICVTTDGSILFSLSSRLLPVPPVRRLRRG
jgi:hypothetical protein